MGSSAARVVWVGVCLIAAACSGSSSADDVTAPSPASTTSDGEAGVGSPGSDGRPGSNGNDAGLDSGPPAASGDLGTLTVKQASIACPGNPGPGSTCQTVTVSCPGLADIDATIAVAVPAGGATKGTIIGHAGGSGTAFFNATTAGAGFTAAYNAAGFRFVQVKWADDWAGGGSGIRAAACRPATAFRWVYDHLHNADNTKGFCGTGSSGGSAALSFSLLHYGLKNIWDYMVLAGGPAPARIDYGCDPSLYTGAPRNLCPQLTNAPYTYSPGIQNVADSWEKTKTCGTQSPSAADIQHWNDDSVAGSKADFSLPQTGLSWWFCTTTPNETTGQGSFLIEKVQAKNGPINAHCYAGVCTNEEVFQDPAAFSAAVNDMKAGCTPNH